MNNDFDIPPGFLDAKAPAKDDQRDDGGPAFPVLPPCDMEGASAAGYPYPSAGISVRDYFAAKAMQALVSQRCYPYDKNVGIYAYMIAGTMLKARAQ